MARLTLLAALVLTAAGALAQSPPPGLLPASVTGAESPSAVRPASETAAPDAPAARIVSSLRDYPAETRAALFATQAAGEALYRANLPSGRFALGTAGDDDCAQASAALALAEAAAFSGDARLAARAGGAVLSLLTLTELDPADATARRPVASLKGEPTRFAATLTRALLARPAPPGAQLESARQLGAYLLTRVAPSGEVAVGPGEPDAVAATPGLALEALVAVAKSTPGSPCQAGAVRVVAFYSPSVKSSLTMTGSAALLPGFVEVTTLSGNAPGLVAATFALADAVSRAQVVGGRDPLRVGGFAPTPGGTPDAATSAVAVRGLSRAAHLTRQVPDLVRFRRYRAAAVTGLSFVAARKSEAAGLSRAGVAYLTSGAEGAE